MLRCSHCSGSPRLKDLAVLWTLRSGGVDEYWVLSYSKQRTFQVPIPSALVRSQKRYQRKGPRHSGSFAKNVSIWKALLATGPVSLTSLPPFRYHNVLAMHSVWARVGSFPSDIFQVKPLTACGSKSEKVPHRCSTRRWVPQPRTWSVPLLLCTFRKGSWEWVILLCGTHTENLLLGVWWQMGELVFGWQWP